MVSLEVKMTYIMDRMTRMEAEMVAKDKRIAVLEYTMRTKNQRVAVLEDAMEIRDTQMLELEDAFETLEKSVITKEVFTDAIETRDTQMCELEEEMKSLTGRITVTEETDVLLRGMVDQVRNPPYAFQCAYQDYWTADDSVITYDRLTYDEISGGSIYNVTGGLDITTGVFTAGFSGVWTISYTMTSFQYSGEYNVAWLYVNGEQIVESKHYTGYYGSEGRVDSLGSRSLYMRLEAGDTISLRTGFLKGLNDITLCFELAQFDWVP